jgi:phospholipid/cholesterol/gamma-HCH transport system permease protein
MATTSLAPLPTRTRFPVPEPPPRPSRAAGVGTIPRRAYAVVEESADLVVLLARTLIACVTPPFSWRPDFVEESFSMIRRSIIPVAVTTFAVGYANGVVEAGQLLGVLGTPDRTGGFFVMVSIRELSIWVTSMVLAGVVGSAICADLGARKVRNELDAMEVMGVDVVRTLVVPRFLSLGIFTLLVTVIGAWAGLAGGMAGQVLIMHEPAASFFGTLWANLTLADVLGFVGKTLVIGFIIAIVNCYKGMTAKGGPQGVGRAVNQAVVIAFTVIWAFQFLFTATFLAAFPESLDFH